MARSASSTVTLPFPGLIALHLVEAVKAVSRTRLESFLGPEAGAVAGLVDAQYLVERAGILTPATPTTDPIGGLRPAQAHEADLELERWFAWLAYTGDHVAALRLIPQIPATALAVTVLEDCGRHQLQMGNAAAVLAAVEHTDRAGLTTAATTSLGCAARENLDRARPSPKSGATTPPEPSRRRSPRHLVRRNTSLLRSSDQDFFTLLWAEDFVGAAAVARAHRMQALRSLEPMSWARSEIQHAYLEGCHGNLHRAQGHAWEALRLAAAHNNPPNDIVIPAQAIGEWCRYQQCATSQAGLAEQATRWSELAPDPATSTVSKLVRASAVHESGDLTATLAIAHDEAAGHWSGSTVARAANIMFLADIALLTNDHWEIERCRQQFNAIGATAEAMLMKAYLARSHAGLQHVRSVITAPRTRLATTRLRAEVALAEQYRIAGDHDAANVALHRAVTTGASGGGFRFVSNMLSRQPSWSQEIDNHCHTRALPRPAWLPSAGLSGATTAANTMGRLTAAEVKVLSAAAQGCTAVEAAHRLSLSQHTVRQHLKSVYRKLDVHKRSHAIAAGRAAGYIA